MTTKRMISGDIWRDEFIGSLDFFQRILWIGLITTCADDQGRLLDDGLIRNDVFPRDEGVTNATITEALDQFAAVGKIVRYTAGGKKLIQIVNWWKYQQPQWASPSKYPAPDGWTDRCRYHAKGNQVITFNWDKDGGYPLGSILPTPLGSDLPYAIEDGDGEGESESRGVEGAAAAAPLPAASRSADPSALKVFANLTGMIVYPASETVKCEDAMNGLTLQHPGDLQEYLQPFWDAWKERRYKKTNCAWLYDWAIAGEIPPDRRAGKGRDSPSPWQDPDQPPPDDVLKILESDT